MIRPTKSCTALLVVDILLSAGALTELQSQHQNGIIRKRIVHSDPERYRDVSKVHGGAGTLSYVGLLGSQDFETNVIFLHRGVLQPKSGIGHHFHNQMEEMFVIFDNRAQFTVDGRTAELSGPAAVPCRMGSSHGIHNPTDSPTQWMNIAVGSVRGRYDAFDLGDDRTGAPLDPKPVFIHVKFDRSLLKPVTSVNGGRGTVSYRRALGPEVFRTNWGFVDHVVVPQGSSIGYHRHDMQEEIYFVLSGRGRATIKGEQAEITTGDGIPVRLKEAHSFETTAAEGLELMIIGVAMEKGKFDEIRLPSE